MQKRYVCLLLVMLMPLTSCQNTPIQNNPSAIQTTETQSSAAANPLYTEPAASESNLGDISFETDMPLTSDPMAICNLFPDTHFAQDIADLFDKRVIDTVTFEELAGYTGGFGVGPGEYKSIEGIGYLTGLTSFYSAKNDLEELPSEIGNLINLKSIDLCKSYNFKYIPPEIKNLKKLEFLRFSLTELEELPAETGELENLRILMADNTKITSLPDEIGNLKNLEFLDVHSDNIDSVPDSISNLVKLEALDISYTGLKELPEKIGNLAELKRLDLFGCNLKTLPESVKNLEKLRCLNVYDNFDLNEKYKKWFLKDVYECKDDPENDEGWMDKWYYYR